MNSDPTLHMDHLIKPGANDTIVLIEGIGAGLAGWDLFIDGLPSNLNIIRYDHPCAGLSRLNRQRNLIDNDFLEALDHVLQIANGNIHIVGYSLGGFLALRYLTSCNSHKDVKKK